MTNKRLQLAIALSTSLLTTTPFGAVQAAAGANADVGVSDLLAMPVMLASDFVGRAQPKSYLLADASGISGAARSHVYKPAQVKYGAKKKVTEEKAAAPKIVSGQVAIQTLLSGQEVSVTDLIAGTLGTAADPIAPAAVVTVASKARVEDHTKNKDVTVRVVIPMQAGAEPAAVKMTTAEALASKPVAARQAVAASPGAAALPELSLEVKETATGLKVTPAVLTMVRPGQIANLKIENLAGPRHRYPGPARRQDQSLEEWRYRALFGLRRENVHRPDQNRVEAWFKVGP